MARISLITPEAANPEVREIYDKVLRGKPGNIQKALAHRPEMLKNFLTFYASVGRSLDRKLYEMIYLRVSLINGCRYCTQHHVASSKRAGLAAEDWSALRAGNYSHYNEKERAALNYVEKLTRAARDYRDGFRRAEETFFRGGNRGHSHARGPCEPDQPRNRSSGPGAGVSGREDLRAATAHGLQNFTGIADAPRHTLAIEIFQQRDGVLAGDAG